MSSIGEITRPREKEEVLSYLGGGERKETSLRALLERRGKFYTRKRQRGGKGPSTFLRQRCSPKRGYVHYPASYQGTDPLPFEKREGVEGKRFLIKARALGESPHRMTRPGAGQFCVTARGKKKGGESVLLPPKGEW